MANNTTPTPAFANLPQSDQNDQLTALKANPTQFGVPVLPNDPAQLDDTLYGIPLNVPNTPTTSPLKKTPSGSFSNTSPSTTVTGATNVSSNIDLQTTNFSPQPNIMDNYNAATYSIKFYLLQDYPKPNLNNQVIIAQSGDTGLNIQSLTIEAIVGPNDLTRNMNAYRFTMTLFEPLGTNLPDRLYAAANKLQISNYYKAPWYLDVGLHGYDTNGKPVTIMSPKTYQVMLVNVQTRVNEQGSMHTIEAIISSDHAASDAIRIIPENVALSPGPTVGDVLRDLMTKRNNDILAQYGSQVLQYEIADSPYSAAYNAAVASPLMHRIDSNQIAKNSPANPGQTQYSSGTDIPSIIESLFSISDTAVAQARLTRTVPFVIGTPPVDVFSILHRIETKTEIVNYDNVLNDYTYKITYIIHPHVSIRLVDGSNIALAGSADVTQSAKKLQFLTQNNFLSKQYDYLFTGLNTEVLNMDIDLNFRWAVSTSIFYGAVTYPGAHVGIAYDAKSSIENLRPQVLALQQQLNDLQSNTQFDPNPLETQAALQSKINSTLAQQQTYNQQIQQQDLSRKGQVSGTTYAEDLPVSLTNLQNLVPITYANTGEQLEHQTTGANSGNTNGVRSVYGVLLNQYYGTGDYSALAKITIEIRGDPYWIGTTNISFSNNSLSYTDYSSAAQTSTASNPNYYLGDHVFILRFRMPQGYNETTKTVKFIDSENYTGFYAVNKVTHEFKDGMFTQKLEAVRIPNITIQNAIAQAATNG